MSLPIVAFVLLYLLLSLAVWSFFAFAGKHEKFASDLKDIALMQNKYLSQIAENTAKIEAPVKIPFPSGRVQRKAISSDENVDEDLREWIP